MAKTPRRSLRRVYTMLRPHAAGEGTALGTGALFGIVVVTLHVLRPWPLKWILDYLGGESQRASAIALMPGTPSTAVLLMSGLFVALAVAGAAAEYAQNLLINGVGNRVLFRFRAALFARILRQPLSFHESYEVGELLTRVVYDTSRLRRGVNGILVRIFQNIALFIGVFLVLLWIDWALAVVLLIAGAIALGTMRHRGRRIATAARKQRLKEGRLASLVGGELIAIRELQAFSAAGSAVQARFASRNNRSLRQEQKVRRLAAGLLFRVDTILSASIALALWLGTNAVLSERLTLGDLVLFFAYASSLRGPIADFAFQTARLGRMLACGDRLYRIARRSLPEDAPGAVVAAPCRGELRFEDVAVKAHKRSRSGRKWTLDGLSCAFPAGKRVAVIGANGAGKSTLLSLVLRLVDPRHGRLLLDGRDVREYTIESLRGQISAVFQQSVLTGMSVRDNIGLGVPGVGFEAIETAAVAARAHDFITRLPLGYDTPVRRGGDLFSGGERQRLALARALLRDGRIWLLDEPTSGLDPATVAELTTMLLEVTRNRTTLWVTHDPDLILRLDWVVVMEQGKSMFSGNPDEYRAAHARRRVPAASS